MDLNRLSDSFPVERLSFRVGSTTQAKDKGMALAYIDARDVYTRLDEVCGPENWQVDYPWSNEKKVCCRIGINVNGAWVFKANGAGDTDYEGDKGAFSDAIKRAAVPWGIGKYLYDSPNIWAPIEQRGKSYVFTSVGLSEIKRKFTAWQQKTYPTPLAAQGDAVRESFDSISAIKEGIATGDLSTANEVSDAIIQQAKQEVADYFIRYNQCVERNFHSLAHIKHCIDQNDLSSAKEAYNELSHEDQTILKLAYTKGGIFTTAENATMKSNDWHNS